MELAAGGNLRQRLEVAKDGQLELAVAIRVLTQVAYALRHAHRQGVLHLGLKPENVLFDHLGNVKLADFGMARILDQPEQSGPGSRFGGQQYGRLSRAGATSGQGAGFGGIFRRHLRARDPLLRDAHRPASGRRSPLPSQAREGVPEAFDEVFDRMTRDALDERYSDVGAVLDGVYEAFAKDLVFESGTMLAWAEDPGPAPDFEAVLEAFEALDEPEPVADGEFEALPRETPEPAMVPIVAPESSSADIAGDLPLPLRVSTRPPPPPPPADD